ARIVLGALGSAPVVVEEAGSILTDQTLGPDTIAAAADEAWKRARPMDNTDQTRRWRKTVVRAYVTRALESLNRPDA
ncbi:MAG: hypothetical protein R3E12_18110, partial [Candidatus Eisenbacteria bacterium]